jgi:hypothetical protein
MRCMSRDHSPVAKWPEGATQLMGARDCCTADQGVGMVESRDVNWTRVGQHRRKQER